MRDNRCTIKGKHRHGCGIYTTIETMRDNRRTIIKIFKFRIYNCKDKESAAHTMHKNAERCLVRKTSFDY